ncbi:hypothetical protein BH20ACI2_BH20ACI2_19190 [soil metagenome]
MKRCIFNLVVLLTAAVSLQAQTAPDAVELTRSLNEFLAGAGRNDAAIHDRFWADDLIYTRSAGTRVNKEELMKGVRSAPAAKQGDPVTVYTSEDVRIQQYGNAAVVAFRLVGTTTRSDGSKSISNHLNTGTFINRNGKWQVVAWQATIVPAPRVVALAEIRPEAANESPETAASTTGAASPVQRAYVRGPRGGCYYVNASGRKVYVEQSNCK